MKTITAKELGEHLLTLPPDAIVRTFEFWRGEPEYRNLIPETSIGEVVKVTEDGRYVEIGAL